MGGSRLSVKSAAFAKQAEFYKKDQSRLEKNKLVTWDPFYSEDGLLLLEPLDTQDDESISPKKLGPDNRLSWVQALKGGQMGKKFTKKDGKNSASKKCVRAQVSKKKKRCNYFDKKESTSYAHKGSVRVRGLEGDQESTYTSDEENMNFSSEEDTTFSPRPIQKMSALCFGLLVEALENKRASIREKALLELVDTFERGVLQEQLETWCITIFYGCLNSFFEGSASESCLASRVIGFLAITVGAVSDSHEMMQNSIPRLSLALEANCELLRLSVLDCLAITTFFGANEVDEVETSMSIMWDIFHLTSFSEPGEMNELSAAVLAKAISAWSLLLTRIDSWRISQQLWKESISIFFTLLDDDDCGVHIAAAEAIAGIIETNRLDKFTRKGDVDITEISSKIKKLVDKAKGSPMEDLKRAREMLEPILEFLETGKYHVEPIDIPNMRDPLEVSTATKSIEIKFFNSFLGWSGFLKHMQDNKVLHDIFGCEVGKIENAVIEEKVKQNLSTLESHKGRMQLRTKHRMLVKDMNYGYGHFDVTCQD
ncbi:uncharacterized protein A4U43_C07F30260 [Asparagus officinalis]|uniref:Interferon-related developmental regulator N-terminal domain-containing protein n=1 Tax=Asparagus officinalis TaxID=4686 RepID=A0A5P1EFY9_ASPOF|nr:uncharacterized protein LOC109849844 [Asparagus officinalis]ONK64816.1 uncharacterized protein A4U43_C07F30260 [Asparagus officinalis]